MRWGWRTMKTRFAVVILALGAVGCGGGPSVGTVVELKKSTVLFFDEKLFNDAADLVNAGGRVEDMPQSAMVASLGHGGWEILIETTKVRVLRSEPNGFKVRVESAIGRDLEADKGGPDGAAYRDDRRMQGKIGWIVKSALR